MTKKDCNVIVTTMALSMADRKKRIEDLSAGEVDPLTEVAIWIAKENLADQEHALAAFRKAYASESMS